MVDLDEALIATSSEIEPWVEERLHERPVDEHVDVVERRPMLLGA